MNRLFPSQQENETIYLVIREHWVHLALKLFVWIILLVVLIILKVAGPTYAPDLFTDQAGQVTSLFFGIYELFLLLSLFIICLLHYLNIQVITNLRVVDVSQEGLFSHTVSELHIDKIEDATSETLGILGTMFDYGMVHVQTAGAKERFEFQNVPHPGKVEKMVLDLYEKNSNFVQKE